MTAGRPSLFTPERCDTIIAALELSLTEAAAAGMAGIDGSTLTNWKKRGESGEDGYSEFLARIGPAKDAGRARLERVVSKAADTDPAIAMKILAIRHPEWRAPTKVEVQHSGTVGLEGAFSTLSDARLAGVLKKLGIPLDD